MAKPTKLYHCIEITIGNTNFQIIFSPNTWFQRDNWNIGTHFHLFCECHYLKTGNVLLTTPDDSIQLTENVFFILPANIAHSFETISGPAERINFYIAFSPNSDEQYNTYSMYNKIFSTNEPIIYRNFNERFNSLLQLVQTDNSSDFLFQLKSKNLFSLILIELLEITESPTKLSTISNMSYDNQLKLKLEAFMLKNFSYNAKLDDLAQYLHVSPRQAERTVKRIFNKSFQEFKTEKRVEEAKHLLLTSTLPIKTIAETLGYNSYTSFFKTFQLYTGLSPEEYRNFY